MNSPPRILALTRYGPLGASSRLRMLQFFPALRQAQQQVTLQPFFSDAMLAGKYASGRYALGDLLGAYAKRLGMLLQAKKYDLLWIEKEALPWWPASLERWLLRHRPYVMDFDDAVFHTYDQHRLALVRLLLGQRLDDLMKHAACVVAGNAYLAERATRAGAPKVVIVPTVIDLERYPWVARAPAQSADTQHFAGGHPPAPRC